MTEAGSAVEKHATIIVDAGLTVHRALGPGLLESAYTQCLEYELLSRGLGVAREVALPLVYRGISLETVYRLDIMVENAIIVEVKSVDALTRLHVAQILSYLKLTGCKIGFLMNFNTHLFKHGLQRVVHSGYAD